MYEFVFFVLLLRLGPKATEAIYHGSHSRGTNPHIAIDDPDDIALGFPVPTTHVSDLGIGTKLMLRTSTEALGIIFFDKYASIVIPEVSHQAL